MKNTPSPFISSERKSKYEKQENEKNIPQYSVDLKMIIDECTNLVRIVRIFYFFFGEKNTKSRGGWN